jgi:hypothetical protein
MSNTGKQKSKSLEDLVVASTSSTSVMAWKKNVRTLAEVLRQLSLIYLYRIYTCCS